MSGLEDEKPAESGTASRAFRKFWLADVSLRLGSRVWMMALPIIAIEFLSADSRHVGYLASASTVCYLLVGLPAGVWIDLMVKRRVMIMSALIRAALLASVPLLWLTGLLSLPSLFVVTLLVGVTTLFYDIAYQSYIPLLVGAKHSYNANSRLEMTSRAVNAASPAIIGAAMKVVSAPLLVLIDAIGYVVCALMLRRVPEVEQKRPNGAKRRLREEILEGFRFIWNEKALRVIAYAVVLSNFFATGITTLVPVLVLSNLDLGPATLGLVYAAGESGGLAGALMLGAIRKRLGLGRVLAGGLIVAAMFTALIPLAANLGDKPVLAQILLMISLFGTAVGGVTFAVSQVSLRQMICPSEILSRVSASMRFVIWGTMPFASISAGACAYYFGVQPTLWLAAVGATLTVLPILGIVRQVSASEPQRAARA